MNINVMAKFLFKSNYQKRFENGKLTSVSYSVYDFHNITLGSGDQDSLDNSIVEVFIQGILGVKPIRLFDENDK